MEEDEPDKFQPTSVDINNAALYAEYRLREKFRKQSPVATAFGGSRGYVDWTDTSDDLTKIPPYPCIWDQLSEEDEEQRKKIRQEKCPYGRYTFNKKGCLAIRCVSAIDGVPMTRHAFLEEQKTMGTGGKSKWGEFCFLNAKNTRIPNYKHPMDMLREMGSAAMGEYQINPNDTHSTLTWWDEASGVCRMAPPSLTLTDHELVLQDSPKYDRVFEWMFKEDPDYGSIAIRDVRKFIKRGMPLLKYDRPYCEGKVKISYDPQKMICYRKPGQYIAEEFVIGGLYREMFGYGESDWRKRVPPRLPDE